MPGSALSCLFNLEPAALCMAFCGSVSSLLVIFNHAHRWQSTVCSLSLSLHQGIAIPGDFAKLFPWALSDCFFSQTSSQPGFLLGTLPGAWLAPQPRIGHQPQSLSLSFLITLFKNRFLTHTKLALGGCSISYTSLVPCHRWPHLHGVKDTNLKHTKQVPQNEP